jgi:hypothetical protein
LSSADAGVAPPPALFVREDTDKRENRLNLSLFALLNVPSFRDWFLDRLELPSGSVVYPPQNVAVGRPDLVVVDATGRMAAWVEVELGAENAAQMAVYRQALSPTRVMSIVGEPTPDTDLSLREIAAALDGPLQRSFDPQQAKSAEVFRRLVELLAHRGPSFDYVVPGDDVRSQPLVQALSAHLGDRLVFGAGAVPRGKLQVQTITQKGWTVRAYSPVAAGRSVALLWDQSMGANRLHVHSLRTLRRYPPRSTDAITEYGRLLSVIDPLLATLEDLPEQRRAAVSGSDLAPVVDRLAECLRRIAATT